MCACSEIFESSYNHQTHRIHQTYALYSHDYKAKLGEFYV